jgi:hypothetical protein
MRRYSKYESISLSINYLIIYFMSGFASGVSDVKEAWFTVK